MLLGIQQSIGLECEKIIYSEMWYDKVETGVCVWRQK